MSQQPVTLRSVAPTVYLPSLLYGIGQGAIAPVLPLLARELGASVGEASLIVAMLGVGLVLGDIPAGWLAGRIGERPAMITATVVVLIGLVGCLLATELWVLGVAVTLIGAANSVWMLARIAYLAEVMPLRLRARAMSTLGGTLRIGAFVGPFLAAALIPIFGLAAGFWIHIVAAAIAGLVLLTLPEVDHRRPSRTTDPVPIRAVIRNNARVLRTLGIATILVGAARGSRQVVLPLWGDHLGLDAGTTALIFGISGGVDMLLFYPAGKVMDRFGRRWIAVPSMLLLGLSLVLLPLTNGIGTLTAVAMLMGLGNGIGSGIIMTLGADVSPSTGRSAFLGVWRLFPDVGNGVGPLTITVVSALGTLGSAIASIGVVAGLAALALWKWISPTPVETDQAAEPPVTPGPLI